MAKPSPKSANYAVQPPGWPELVASVHQAREATNASGASLALTNNRAGEIVCHASSGAMAPEPGTSLLTEDSLTAQCIRSGKQLHCHNVETDSRVCSDAAGGLAARSFVITPIQRENQVIGVLAVFSETPGAFSPVHLAKLKTAADKIAVILRDEDAPVAVQGRLQLSEKGPEAPWPNASKPKPPLSTRLPLLSGNEVRREPPPELRVVPAVEPSTEQLPAVPMASDQGVATSNAVSGRKLESATTRLILIAAAAVLVIAASATWAHLRRNEPSPVDAATTTHPVAPVAAEKSPQSAESAPKTDTGEQHVNTAEQKPRSSQAVSLPRKAGLPAKSIVAERGNAASTRSGADSDRSGNAVELASTKGTVALPLPTPTSNPPQPQLSVPIAGNNLSLSLTAPPDTAIAPKQAPLLKSDIVPARVISSVPPQYPAAARQMGVSGTVVVRAQVAKDGSLSDLKFLSGPPMLRKAALDAVKLWRYTPATLNGQVVEQAVEIKVEFRPNTK